MLIVQHQGLTLWSQVKFYSVERITFRLTFIIPLPEWRDLLDHLLWGLRVMQFSVCLCFLIPSPLENSNFPRILRIQYNFFRMLPGKEISPSSPRNSLLFWLIPTSLWQQLFAFASATNFLGTKLTPSKSNTQSQQMENKRNAYLVVSTTIHFTILKSSLYSNWPVRTFVIVSKN